MSEQDRALRDLRRDGEAAGVAVDSWHTLGIVLFYRGQTLVGTFVERQGVLRRPSGEEFVCASARSALRVVLREAAR